MPYDDEYLLKLMLYNRLILGFTDYNSIRYSSNEDVN